MKPYQGAIVLALWFPMAAPMAAHSEENVRNLALNRAAYASTAADYINTGHMATDGHLDTRWRSLGGHRKGDEQPWIYVDLGAECTLSKVVLKWEALYPAKYDISVSTNTGPSPDTGLVEQWKSVFGKENCKGGVEEIPLKAVKARYVRLYCHEQDAGLPEGIGLAEFEVYGTGGPVIKPAPVPSPDNDGIWNLSGGWKLVSQGYAADDATRISTSGYDDSNWLPATVPGTILASYLNAGAIPDPWYADQLSQISDWFCRTSWWYRTELELPESYRGKRVWLNLDGINYRAEVFVNGTAVGKMAGAFIRGRYDITDKVVGGKNAIAVLIHPMTQVREPFDKRLDKVWTAESFSCNAPTFIVAAGWDWAPCMRDRNMGIWQRVFLSTNGDVAILDPYVVTELPLLPDTSQAELTVKTELQNQSDQPRSGMLRGKLGEVTFEKRVTVGAKETLSVAIDKSTQPALLVRNPKLWWPNGYGEQNLHDFALRFETDDGKVSDQKTARVGIRKFTCDTKRPLTFFCNGQKIMVKGANWCMDEGMLRLEREGFRARLQLEKNANFTLIRSTLGAITKEDFFDLCDEYGLLVWDEFGANHEHAVLHPDIVVENARDRVRRFRNHASIVLWCGANEHGPHGAMEPGMKEAVEKFDGTRHFLPNSTLQPPMEGDGPYTYCGPGYYFGLAKGMRAEVGLKAVPVVESVRRMMPRRHLWPITQAGWGSHEWVNAGNNAGWCGDTEKAIARYGTPNGVEDFCRKAQMVSMESGKAIFEGWNDKMWNDCTGVLIWMSNPCWPCLTFNIYDHYLEPTAGYYGCKKACEPVHVQWSILSGEVKVINNTLQDFKELTAEARIYQMDGEEYSKKSVRVDSLANAVTKAFDLADADSEKTHSKNDLSKVYFIKLELKDRDGRLLSDNFYWQSRSSSEYEELSKMPKVGVTGAVTPTQDKDVRRLTIEMQNGDKGVALMTRLKLVDPVSGLLVAPVIFSDNYFSLMRGGSKRVTAEFNAKHVSGEQVLVLVEGWNVNPAQLARILVNQPTNLQSLKTAGATTAVDTAPIALPTSVATATDPQAARAAAEARAKAAVAARESWEIGLFVKHPEPVLRPNPDSVFKCPILGKEVRWEQKNTYNPAAVLRNGKVHLLYRADDANRESSWGRTCRVGLATSEDGIHFTRHPEPVLYPDNDEFKKYEWAGGCEDLHVIEGEDGVYYMNYTTHTSRHTGIKDTMSVASSRDLVHWTKHGLAFGKLSPMALR